MGEVYLAEHLSLKKQVAVKVLPPDLVSRDSVERFIKEARTCSRIEHPNVVVIYDVGQHAGLYYIVMQYVLGQNLTEVAQQYGGRLPWRSALRVCQLAARGLHAVHSQGLVHRDVKPSNIMLSRDSRVLLMDFGLVREEGDSGLTQTGQMVGTPSFMSPEQCRGETLDRRSDIYSLGCTLYGLLAGAPPFSGTLQEVLAKIASGASARPLRQIVGGLPEEVSQAVSKAMAPRRMDRFPTAEAMAKELRRVQLLTPADLSVGCPTEEWSCPSVQTHSVVPVAPLELLPLDTVEESSSPAKYWPFAAVLFAVFLGFGILLNWPRGKPAVESLPAGAVESKPKPKPAEPTSDPSRPPPQMVYIEAGYARIGNSLQTVIESIESTPLLAQLKAANPNAFEIAMMQVRNTGVVDTPRRAHVPAFWIDPYEVTNAEYARFVTETNHEVPTTWNGNSPPADMADHPVHGIRFRDAEAYVKWAGRQLPTLEQWMRAFRGDSEQFFPWGDKFESERTNTAENRAFSATAPVSATPLDVSPMKVFNLVGNVAEYLRDTTVIQGQRAVLIKGAHFAAPGAVNGMGAVKAMVAEGIASPGFGFRCVWEPPASAR
jgi:serine/threonine protein kinase